MPPPASSSSPSSLSSVLRLAGSGPSALPDLLNEAAELHRTLRIGDVIAFAALTRYDGAVTVHFRGGVPMKVEAGRPIQVNLASDPSARDSSLDAQENPPHTTRV